MNSYKITITHTVEDNYRLIFNKKDLKKVIAKFDYIQKAVLTHKNYISNLINNLLGSLWDFNLAGIIIIKSSIN